MSNVKTPWLAFYGEVAPQLSYPDCSMFDMVERCAEQYPNYAAITFMGRSESFQNLVKKVKTVARAFAAIGIGKGDKVTLCMPNCPQIVLCFYALNRIGANASMIHPLSSEGEIAFYIKDSESKAVVTLDAFYGKFKEVRKSVSFETLVLTSISDALSPVMKVGYALTEGKKVPRVPKDADFSPGRISSKAQKRRMSPALSNAGRWTPPSSFSPAAQRVRPRASCSPTSTSTRSGCKPSRWGTASCPARGCSPPCRCSTGSVWAFASIQC
jgi:acyl-CoA synthetase (AMP-forming)/AMP-acid ligase II